MEGFSARDRTCQGTGGQPWDHRGPFTLNGQSMKCMELAVHRCSCSAESGLRGAESVYIRASLRQTQSTGSSQPGLHVKMVILKGEKIQKEQLQSVHGLTKDMPSTSSLKFRDLNNGIGVNLLLE